MDEHNNNVIVQKWGEIEICNNSSSNIDYYKTANTHTHTFAHIYTVVVLISSNSNVMHDIIIITRDCVYILRLMRPRVESKTRNR